MRTAYICCPLGGEVKANLEKAKKYAKYAFECGMAPVVPHFFAEILDDNDPKQRELGVRAGLSLLFWCDELWVFGGKISKGMKQEINFAKKLNIKTRRISYEELRKSEVIE